MPKPAKKLQENWGKFKEQLNKRLDNATPNMVGAIQDMLANYNSASPPSDTPPLSVGDLAKKYKLNDSQENYLHELKNQWSQLQKDFADKKTGNNSGAILIQDNEMETLRKLAVNDYSKRSQLINHQEPNLKFFQILASNLSDASVHQLSNKIQTNVNSEMTRLESLDKIKNNTLRELAKTNFNLLPMYANALTRDLESKLDNHPTKSSIKTKMKEFNVKAKAVLGQKLPKDTLVQIFNDVQNDVLAKIDSAKKDFRVDFRNPNVVLKKNTPKIYYYELKVRLKHDIFDLKLPQTQAKLDVYAKQIESLRAIIDNLKKLDKLHLTIALHGDEKCQNTAKKRIGRLEGWIAKLEKRHEKAQAKLSEFGAKQNEIQEMADSLSRSRSESTASTSSTEIINRAVSSYEPMKISEKQAQIDQKRTELDDLYKKALSSFDSLINALPDDALPPDHDKGTALVNKEGFEQLYTRLNNRIDADIQLRVSPDKAIKYAMEQCKKYLHKNNESIAALQAKADTTANNTAPASDDTSPIKKF